MNKAFIGLGSNVGDRLANLKSAILSFSNNNDFADLEYSSIYETKPYGEIEQENFFNAVISVKTSMEIAELFIFTKNLERELGRKKRKNWGPREIDLDILLFNNEVVETDQITIPHKDLLNRDFVLVPLLELDNTIIHPVNKKPLKSYLDILDDKYIINKINVKFEM